ncbi:MAG: MFS transporter, partial [Clostridia bacterium]|nr:MFS transporter [Clostridia bacterium]
EMSLQTDKIEAFRSAIGFSTVLFWIMAIMVGTVQGGIQAVSRSYYGKLIPKERSNEYYGFFDIFGKFASFLGPVIYSVMAQITGRSSVGVLGLAILFIAGLVLLVVSKKHLEVLEKQASAN